MDLSLSQQRISAEMSPERKLVTAKKGQEIYIVDSRSAPNTMIELGKQRELSFRGSGGGTGGYLDLDFYDYEATPYKQLIVWDPEDREIVGGYRFQKLNQLQLETQDAVSATAHLFRFSSEFVKNYAPQTIELGRSFISKKYQLESGSPKSRYAFFNLWYGLGALTIIHPEIKYFFGKITLYPQTMSPSLRSAIYHFFEMHFQGDRSFVTPRESFVSSLTDHPSDIQFTGDYKVDRSLIINYALSRKEYLPPLVFAYSDLSSTMKTFGTSVNSEFGEVEETCLMVKIDDINESKKKTFIYNNQVKHLRSHEPNVTDSQYQQQISA